MPEQTNITISYVELSNTDQSVLKVSISLLEKNGMSFQLLNEGDANGAVTVIDLDTTVGRAFYDQFTPSRGKTVLLYFWNSDNVNSRRMNKKLKTVYEKYKSGGFEVYAVSLDQSKESWKTAIAEDGLNWINVSNLAGADDGVAGLYMAVNIPYLILIDKKGVISAKGIDFAELETKIKALR